MWYGVDCETMNLWLKSWRTITVFEEFNIILKTSRSILWPIDHYGVISTLKCVVLISPTSSSSSALYDNHTTAFKSAAENIPSDLPFISATSYELLPFLATTTHGLYCGPNLALKFLPASDSAKLLLKIRCPTENVGMELTFAASISILQSS
ncbi:uncharacterized protein LOC134206771 [Armigeres subalbatus]|uniref:uncharacterized protein LOC134206771 n=1 Tax=Armigeres subalbatus TaxID=124917 RepID=UPI002ED091C3